MPPSDRHTASVAPPRGARMQTGTESPLPSWLFSLTLFGGPLAVVSTVAVVRRGRRRKHTARPVRATLERAAAAAIACNVGPTQARGDAGRPSGRGRAPGRPRGAPLHRNWSALPTLGLLQSPLRERIYLERLVFLSVEHCAAQPETVADVILHVRLPWHAGPLPAHAALSTCSAAPWKHVLQPECSIAYPVCGVTRSRLRAQHNQRSSTSCWMPQPRVVHSEHHVPSGRRTR